MQGNACNPQSLLPLEERRAGKREIADLKLVASIREIQQQTHGVYGSPRVTLALRNRGQTIGKNRVARVMRLHGIQAKTAHKYKATTDSQHGLPVAPNLLERSFAVGQEQSVWVSDITYIWTREGWLYLCAILELSTRAILGWSIQPRLTRYLVLNALNMACYRRKDQFLSTALIELKVKAQYRSRSAACPEWKFVNPGHNHTPRPMAS